MVPHLPVSGRNLCLVNRAPPRHHRAGRVVAILRVEFCKGDKVEARYRKGKRHYPGTISGVGGDGTYAILYDDGESETGVTADLIRVPDSGKSKKNGAQSGSDGSGTFAEGDKVEARYRKGKLRALSVALMGVLGTSPQGNSDYFKRTPSIVSDLCSNSSAWGREEVVEIGYRRLVEAIGKLAGASRVDMFISDHAHNHATFCGKDRGGIRDRRSRNTKFHTIAPQYWTWPATNDDTDESSTSRGSFGTILAQSLAPTGDVRHKCLSTGRLVREIEVIKPRKGEGLDLEETRSEAWYIPLKYTHDDNGDSAAGSTEYLKEEMFGFMKISRPMSSQVKVSP